MHGLQVDTIFRSHVDQLLNTSEVGEQHGAAASQAIFLACFELIKIRQEPRLLQSQLCSCPAGISRRAKKADMESEMRRE